MSLSSRHSQSDAATATSADPSRAVYAISVVSELTGLQPQSIRSYEQHGLLTPARTEGGTRRYSDSDVGRLVHIGGLIEGGLNLAGVEAVLALEAENRRLRQEIDDRRARRARTRGGAGA